MKLSCHLVLANACRINYISYSRLLNPFIKRLVTSCNYSDGYYPDPLATICLDVQHELKDYCLAHQEYTVFGKLFAVSFSEDYSKISFLVDARLFMFSHKTLDNIALSLIGTINYVILVNSGHYSPAHCALVEIYGKGALICAPSGSGKSTCAARLPKPHKALADDCALLMRSGNDFIAQAMPTWSRIINDSLKINQAQFDCSASVKISGIFFLEQSSADTVQELDSYDARSYLNSSFNDQMSWFLIHFPDSIARELRIKMFSLAEQIAAGPPAYRLGASLNGKFWEHMYEALR